MHTRVRAALVPRASTPNSFREHHIIRVCLEWFFFRREISFCDSKMRLYLRTAPLSSIFDVSTWATDNHRSASRLMEHALHFVSPNFNPRDCTVNNGTVVSANIGYSKKHVPNLLQHETRQRIIAIRVPRIVYMLSSGDKTFLYLEYWIEQLYNTQQSLDSNKQGLHSRLCTTATWLQLVEDHQRRHTFGSLTATFYFTDSPRFSLFLSGVCLCQRFTFRSSRSLCGTLGPRPTLCRHSPSLLFLIHKPRQKEEKTASKTHGNNNIATNARDVPGVGGRRIPASTRVLYVPAWVPTRGDQINISFCPSVGRHACFSTSRAARGEDKSNIFLPSRSKKKTEVRETKRI